MASYSVTCDHKSVTFSITGLSPGNVARIVFRKDPGSQLLYKEDHVATSTSLTVTITSYINPETKYACRVYLFEDKATADDQGDNIDLGYGEFTTPSKPSVEPWSWTSSNGSATAAQTQKAYTAITNKGYISDFSYLVWNDLVNKVYEVIDSRGEVWDVAYGTLSQTLMTSTNRVLTAKKFNALRYNVGLRSPTGINEKHAGEIVMGSDFITIALALNKAIV